MVLLLTNVQKILKSQCKAGLATLALWFQRATLFHFTHAQLWLDDFFRQKRSSPALLFGNFKVLSLRASSRETFVITLSTNFLKNNDTFWWMKKRILQRNDFHLISRNSGILRSTMISLRKWTVFLATILFLAIIFYIVATFNYRKIWLSDSFFLTFSEKLLKNY